jgi:hypothetical protein
MKSHIAFSASLHPHCGSQSPAQIIDKNVCQKIIEKASVVTINDYFIEHASLNIYELIDKINMNKNKFVDKKNIKMYVECLYVLVGNAHDENKLKLELEIITKLSDLKFI